MGHDSIARALIEAGANFKLKDKVLRCHVCLHPEICRENLPCSADCRASCSHGSDPRGRQYGDLALDNAVYKGNDRVAEVCTLLKRPPGLMCKFEPVHDLLLLLLRRVMIADS